jgi:hypothetical protein
MIHHVNRVRARYPHAKFLWLVRDPRAVALSSRDSVFNPYHPYYTAVLWREQQRIGFDLHRADPANVQRIHYEQLVREPQRMVHEICNFLDIRFEPRMLKYFESADASVASGLARDWANVARPIQAEKAQRYESELSDRHQRIVESVAGPLMQQLGYELAHSQQSDRDPSQLRKLHYRIANEARRILVEYRSLCHNRNHARRWMRSLRIMSVRLRLRLWARQYLDCTCDQARAGFSTSQDSRRTS